MLENTGQDESKMTEDMQIKYNSEKANKTKYSETKQNYQGWFSRLLRQAASKRGGLILQRSSAHTGQKLDRFELTKQHPTQ